MRLNRIAVKNLFGVFDHDIPLMDGGITIVIGENGLGKTVILEATNAFFSKNFSFFNELVFDKFIFYFENHEYWELSKGFLGNNRNALYVLQKNLENKDSKSKPSKIAELDVNDGLGKNSSDIKNLELRRRYELERMQIMYLDSRRNNSESWEDFERYRYINELLAKKNFSSSNVDAPKWFEITLNKLTVKLIETQRIITVKERGGELYTNNVLKCSKELVAKISEIEKIASDIATDLDSTYPNRLVQKLKQQGTEPFDQLNEALSKLDERRKLLASIGLSESNYDSDLLQIKDDQVNLTHPLKLYIDDSQEKLAPYEQISKQITLFKDIVNKRFKHKELEINKSKGFVFKSRIKKNDKGQYETISPTKLSSGEQNELILFYELIFKTNAGDMILIDEPELSLHISWQNKFIKDLKEVTLMNDVQVVIATHSPDIIDENWDLKVELQGLE